MPKHMFKCVSTDVLKNIGDFRRPEQLDVYSTINCATTEVEKRTKKQASDDDKNWQEFIEIPEGDEDYWQSFT